MSISEDDCFLSFPIENSLYKDTDGLRYRDRSSETSRTNRSREMVSQPMFMYGQKTICEVQTAEDSGYLEDHNLSFTDSPGCVRTSTGSQWEVDSQPDLVTAMEENEASSFPEFQSSAKPDNRVRKQESGRVDLHLLAFRGLVLAVLLGACGFGLMLTFRSSKETLGRWKENGKYRAMEFARESIEERLQKKMKIQNGSISGRRDEEREFINVPASVLQKFEDELDYPDDPSNFRAALPEVEDLDYPDDPNFRPVIPSKKRSQPY